MKLIPEGIEVKATYDLEVDGKASADFALAIGLGHPRDSHALSRKLVVEYMPVDSPERRVALARIDELERIATQRYEAKKREALGRMRARVRLRAVRPPVRRTATRAPRRAVRVTVVVRVDADSGGDGPPSPGDDPAHLARQQVRP